VFSNFLNILILVGSIQGFITFILLRRLTSNKRANRLLSWIILLISLACLNIYFLEAITFSSTLLLILAATLPLVILMPVGPLVYFYVKAILDPDFRLQKRDRPHFYTAFLDLVPYLMYAVLILGSVFGLISSENAEHWNTFGDNYNMYIDIPRWISLVVYLFLTRKILVRYSQKEKNSEFFLWAKRFTLGFAIFTPIWLLHLIPYVIPSLSNELLGAVGWYPLYIPLIVLIYWLGINGYIISFKEYKKNSRASQLSDQVIRDTFQALENAMTKDRLFLNPTLKLQDVVTHIGVSQKIISSVLNQHIGKSFNEYVNSYRIEEFKSRLLSENSQNLTITGIAFECGFNSQATFQRTFKAFTNLSPKEFQQKHSK
jgi:AraC-like DNA-binding protein